MSAPDPSGKADVGAALRRFLPQWRPMEPHARRVLERLARCHTGAAGWSFWRCEACDSAQWRPLGCGDRHCPDCQHRRREEWLERQRKALLPVRCFHVVFTLPEPLRALVLQNPASLYRLLFDAASATLLHLGRERFQAEIGLTALLHTWGQTLGAHPHLHVLVTGGGLHRDPDGSHRWIGPKQRQYLFPVKLLGREFRTRFLRGLQERLPDLTLDGTLDPLREPARWTRWMRKLRDRPWVVFAKGSVAGPEAILQYLGRYTHRVAIANARIRRVDEQGVSFTYKDYRDGDRIKEMNLGGVEFVRRLSHHVLPQGFTKIRHYGLLGNNRRTKILPVAREALERSRWHHIDRTPPPPPPVTEEPECPHCGQTELVCVGRLDPLGKFTPLDRGARRLRIRTGDPPSCRGASP